MCRSPSTVIKIISGRLNLNNLCVAQKKIERQIRFYCQVIVTNDYLGNIFNQYRKVQCRREIHLFLYIFKYFFLLQTPSRLLGPTQSPMWCAPAILLGIKRPEREANHLALFSAAVKNECSYTSTPSIYIYIYIYISSWHEQRKLNRSPCF